MTGRGGDGGLDRQTLGAIVFVSPRPLRLRVPRVSPSLLSPRPSSPFLLKYRFDRNKRMKRSNLDEGLAIGCMAAMNSIHPSLLFVQLQSSQNGGRDGEPSQPN
jgi:hypothetical protein